MRTCLLFTLLFASAALAEAALPVPQANIPPSVLYELRTLEARFDQALSQDCAPERCFSKGCIYREHASVDLPRGGSLPGISPTEGAGSVPVQDYLTRARCEFTTEKSVSSNDANKLARRLEQRLSKGWLQVLVAHENLDPIPEVLRNSPDDAPPKPAAPPEPKVEAPKDPPTFDAKVAARELWLALLPHFSWMIALFLGTLSVLAILWAARRLGKETIEEKAVLQELLAPKPAVPAEAKTDEAQAAELQQAAEGDFAQAQRRVWAERVADSDLQKDESAVVEVVRDWLANGEFALLAKALSIFGDKLSQAFSSDGELAVKKVAFAEYLRTMDEKTLPSDGDFFRRLNQQAISSALLAQADAGVYRSLREEFGPAAIVHLMQTLPPRHGALLYAFASREHQDEIARSLPDSVRVRTAEQLLVTNRISREELQHLFEVLNAARTGAALPRIPEKASNGLSDRGRQFDAAGALSVLLPRIDATHRRELFSAAIERAGGIAPQWYEDILYGDMLLRLPNEVQREMLLEVDVRGLAGWSSLQQPQWQQTFLKNLAPSLQTAVRAGMTFESRADQLQFAQKGQADIVSALKRLSANGKVNLAEIVA